MSCGDTITADTTFDSDLVNCTNNGILIGADDITLDLNGHTVDGDNELVDPCPVDEPCDFGVLNDGYNGVTIKGGAVRQFGTGVFILGVRHNRVRGVKASQSFFNGLIVGDSARSTVRRSTVSANGLETDFPGIVVFGSTHIQIKRNTSTRNADLGLFVIDSNDNRFVRNNLSKNPEAGAIIEGDGNDILRNRVVRNGDGVVLSGSENTIARNHIKPVGCGPGCGIGISLEDGHGNLIAGNEIRHAQDTGIRLRTFVGRQHLRDSVVRRNSVHDAGRHGVAVGSAVKLTLLKGNHVTRAKDDGIHVKNPATTLTRNHASRNGDLGIAAVPGVTDGGDNEAGGNGNPLQCTYVVCG